ncbi:MspA family porin [Mycobacterium sp. CBMA271]|uniref:MspA family porin n=1 Tax=unclassified Mycobacteroides TaxID=2618759 RepID=UPI001326384C|nr:MULTISPECIES: MspA family porin [unclassified Mycobacteroides]MUM19950.1 MspA family protein [Mycobacteroides sp. CBMA 326]MUM20123.1 MspA family porin [Mycobacteroides sp. CBMA 271]
MIARLVTTSFFMAACGLTDAAMAIAEPKDMASQQYSRTTRDGWHLEIRLDHERVNSVPNLAAASNSREAFITLSGTATATGGTNPITDSLFLIGYQLGCQSDVSSGLQIGGSAGVAPSVNVGVLPLQTVGVGGSAGVSGFVQTVVQPGVIVNLPLGNMVLSQGNTGALDLDNVHVKADACGGDVTVRSFASLRVATETGHTEFAIYGDPIKI